jgi:hypothetical protein
VQGLDYSYRLSILVLIIIYFYPGTTFGSIEKGVKEKFTCATEKRQSFNIVKKENYRVNETLKKNERGLTKVHYKESEELLCFKDFI